MGDSRKSSRRVGEWRGRSHLRNGDGDGRSPRDGELVKQGWKPKRTLIYCAWTAKNRDARVHGVGETHVDDFEKARRRATSIQTAPGAAIWTGGFSDAEKNS